LSADVASQELASAVRALLLPLDPVNEIAAIDAVEAVLTRAGITGEDQPRLLRLDAATWRDGGAISTAGKRAFAAALRVGAPQIGERLATATSPTGYLEVHQSLQANRGLTFDEATAFMSHARLIHHLAAAEAMSSAQIAKVLAARDTRADFHWQAIEILLRKLGLRPKLQVDLVDAVIAADRAREVADFADAGVREAAALLGGAAAPLGFPSSMQELALRLVTPNLQRHDAYLRVLFFQCIVAEFYDHALTVPYEFDPRGELARHVVVDHLPTLPGAANAFLNNLKAVDRLDLDWARAKKAAERESAEALAEALAGLDALGFAARKELAGWLRRWVIRVERLVQPLLRPIATAATTAQITAVLRAVGQGETRTSGILEQRVLDVLAQAEHAEAAWRPTGLGDSVFATNLGRRKLGDCEFERADARQIVAYEAHAGTLTELYVEEHLSTLRRVLAMRRPELEGIAALNEWSIEVRLVAHRLRAAARHEELEGVRVVLQPVTFAERVEQAKAADLIPAFEALVLTPLNERRTPQSVRDAYLALVAGV
jgi:hypothetical protein